MRIFLFVTLGVALALGLAGAREGDDGKPAKPRDETASKPDPVIGAKKAPDDPPPKAGSADQRPGAKDGAPVKGATEDDGASRRDPFDPSDRLRRDGAG